MRTSSSERKIDDSKVCAACGDVNRETELAILAYRGYSNREIAEECYISEATVKKHMTHIFEKLGISGREELQNRGADNECKTAGRTDKKTL